MLFSKHLPMLKKLKKEGKRKQLIKMQGLSENAVKGGRRPLVLTLDSVLATHCSKEGKAVCLALLPHGECRAWGNAPQIKFRDGCPPALWQRAKRTGEPVADGGATPLQPAVCRDWGQGVKPLRKVRHGVVGRIAL